LAKRLAPRGWTPRLSSAAAGLILLVAVVAVAVSANWSAGTRVSWENLLAPYSKGTPLPDGFRISEIRRGPRNDVVVTVERPEDGAAVEVHVAQRGQWPGVLESESFGIGYEELHSPAVERAAVTKVLADAIREHDGGLPSPDAIPLGPSFDPTVLPWWLEMLRGERGLLLGGSLSLIALIGISPSPYAALAGLLWAVAALLAIGMGMPFDVLDVGASWLPPAALLLLLGCAVLRRHVHSRDDRLLALGLFGIAMALRAGLGPWGPLHVNGMGPSWVAGASRAPLLLAAYGPGYTEIFTAITRLTPSRPDWAIFASNALFSALLPPLAFVLAQLMGTGRHAALAAGLLLAIDPVSIRMASTESYFPAIIFFCSSAAVSLLFAVREMERGKRSWAATWVVGAGLLLAQAARIHPAAWAPVATIPLVILASARATLATRLLMCLASGVVIGGMLVATSGGVLLNVFGNVRSGTLMYPPSTPPYGNLIYLAAAVAAYAFLVRRPWFAVAAGVPLAAMFMTSAWYGQSWIWQQCYDRLYLTVPLIAVVAALAGLLRQRWFAVTLALVAAFMWFSFARPLIGERTTEHLEYHWLREQLARLPAECRIIHVAGAGNRGVALPTYVRLQAAEAVEIRAGEEYTLAQALAPASCIYYVRTSLCSTPEGRNACAQVENRLRLERVARAVFPAWPSSRHAPYDTDSVETSIAHAVPVGT
jgi:hypothetical protein